MGKKCGRLVSYLLAIALVMQENVMTVRAENGRNDGTGVIASEIEADGEELILDEETENGTEDEAEDTEGILTGETAGSSEVEATEPETTGETGADLEGSEPEEDEKEENVPKADISEESDPAETVPEEITLDGAASGAAETDPETGDIITYGENLFGDTPFADNLADWARYNDSVTAMEVNDEGNGVTVKITILRWVQIGERD